MAVDRYDYIGSLGYPRKKKPVECPDCGDKHICVEVPQKPKKPKEWPPTWLEGG